jgi:hypothetical protein
MLYDQCYAAVAEAATSWRRWTAEKTRMKEFNPQKSNRKPPPYKHVKVCKKKKIARG